MSIASEITRLQTSKADSKAQINIDKDIINDGIDFINNEKVDSYDEKIQEMQEAYKAFIPVNTTSDTQIDATKGGTIISKTLKGNTSQDGTPTPDAPIEVSNVTGEQVVRVCKKNLFDKNTEVTIGKYYNGTGDVVNDASNTLFIQTFYINVLPNTRYNFSANGNDYFKMCEYAIDKTFIQRQLSNTGNTNTYYFITSPNTYFIRVSCATSNINSLQIEKGTSVTSYEPYQGKDYEINLGANLLDIQNSWVNNKSQTSNGIRYILNEDDTISISGTSTNYSGAYARSYNSTDVFMTLKANHKYRLLVEISNKTSNINSRVFFGTTSANISDFSILTMVENGIYYKDYMPTEDIGLTQYSVIGAQAVGETSLTMKVAIYDITANVINDYIPYFEPIELNKIGNYQDFIRKGTGKNKLFLEDKSSTTLNGITYSVQNGVITLSGTTTQGTTIWFDSNIEILNTLKGKKATLTRKIISGSWNFEFDISNKDAHYYWQITGGQTNQIASQTKNVLDEITAKPHVYISNGTSVNCSFIAQAEEGNSTNYEPYGYKDKWYIEKNIRKVVLDGSQGTISMPSTNRFNIDDAITDFLKKEDANLGLSNIYKSYAQKNANGDFNTLINGQDYGFDFSSSGGSYTIRFKDTRYTSIADFKTSLQTNNVIVYYVLANPTYTLIENEELIEQLDRIMQLYEGQNNILVTGDLAATLDLDYIVKAENHL